LSFNTRQLNRATAGAATNQIHDLAALGYLSAAPAPGAVMPALADPTSSTLGVEARARAYLDANCSQCHQPGGTAVGAFDARARTPLSLAGIVNGRLLSGVAAAGDAILTPGDEAHSMLLRRLMGNGVNRMPPVGSNERDRAGESLIAEWIADLARFKPPSRLLNLAARASRHGERRFDSRFRNRRSSPRRARPRGGPDFSAVWRGGRS